MAPLTEFAVKDPYSYLEGLGNYHSSEALTGAIPLVNHSPQKPPYSLRTERISGGAFTQPRDQSMQTFLYRAQASLLHSEFVPLEVESGYGPETSAAQPTQVNPNSYTWNTFPVPDKAHWVTGQAFLGRNGDPAQKEGSAVWVFSVTDNMPERHVFSSLDGEMLIIPQYGALEIQTELGFMMVRQNEIAVIPRGVRYRITLPEGRACRGYICELFQGHFRLPDLGIVGSTGLANVRDFQIPTAFFDGVLVDGVARSNNTPGSEWTIISRLGGRLWHCTQDHTPFDVAGWHGTCYPYKYDLGRFCSLGNSLFDEHDPSLFTVLTARQHGAEPGTAVVDFAILQPRWNVSEDTLWLPYYHRNVMQEFYAPIVYAQEPRHPLNNGNPTGGKTNQFWPMGAGLHGAMSTHGPSEKEIQDAMKIDTTIPQKVQAEGVGWFLLEMERPLALSEWAHTCATRNMQAQEHRLAKM